LFLPRIHHQLLELQFPCLVRNLLARPFAHFYRFRERRLPIHRDGPFKQGCGIIDLFSESDMVPFNEYF
jgi:hypothetical protein